MNKKLVPVLLFGMAAAVVLARSPLDPAAAAPHVYQVEFENEKVRVLKRTVRSGETIPLIAQPDRVVVYINQCAWMDTDADGNKYMEHYEFGTPVWAAAETHGGKTSNVIQTCHIVEVELK